MAKQFLEKIKAKLRYVVTIGLSVLTVFVIYKVFRTTQATEAWMCNSNGYAIRIIDNSVTSEVRSIKSVNDPYFKSFITSITDYISAKFSGAGSCKDNSGEEPMNRLIFVRLPLVTSGNDPLAPPPELDTSLPNITCHLDSPWLKLVIRHSHPPLIQGVFLWNERQFLGDQALLSNQNLSLNSPLVPLSNRLFQQYAADYADSEILRLPSGKSNITERIPFDVLWLFRNSPQTTFIPFSDAARSSMNTILKRATENYINLTQKLFDQCFASTQKVDQRYETVLDLRNTISLEQYQIN
ncbi:MAG: hypothetical protein IM473_17670 [Microcystis sp. M015S2]|jgi:hypothetical protein|uniref:hypothetical protein n=1 Tax=unclassified Microcystis TaxID=2643300 RepID=UPI00258928F6|nr:MULTISPECIES: hypothetical protein [unclassified Microcystis]MCA2708871.1 hypothetical protein [Microcystis sp. M025S2]MCA2744164.1 hypothetical protein [Microcystis sp. M015S2]MCA2760438.1 hypothetical protein [Microcystis sp. M145S2]